LARFTLLMLVTTSHRIDLPRPESDLFEPNRLRSRRWLGKWSTT